MNILVIIRLVCVVFVITILALPCDALTPDQVFDKVKDSIVVVKTMDVRGKVRSQGSGVLIHPGKIATNCHVVEGGFSYRVGRDKQFVHATLYAEDKNKDICLFDAKGITGKPAEIGKAASLRVGKPVYAVGAPKGLELSLSNGIVAQLRGKPPLIQTTAAISPGSSGGGLFDGEGHLVGLTTLYIEGGQSLNFAIPVEWISEIKPGRKSTGEGRSQTEWQKHAIVLEQRDDWPKLLDWCQEWTKSRPKDSDAWNELGVAYHKLKRYNDAIEALRQALRINPEFDRAWYNLGVAYGQLDRYNDAIEANLQTLRINPEFADAWYNLGVAYGQLDRYNDAIEANRQALRIDPEKAEAWVNLGSDYALLNRYADSAEAYRQYLRINPVDADVWLALGLTYRKLNRYMDAIEAFRQALRINPDNAQAWYYLGLAYYSSGNRTAALNAARELRRFDPERAEKLFNLIVPR